jgi:hypothetical protein
MGHAQGCCISGLARTYKRALSLTNALALAAASRGFTVSEDDKIGRLVFTGYSADIQLRVTEMLEDKTRPRTRYDGKTEQAKYKVPTGRLRITLQTGYREGPSFEDRESRKLESQARNADEPRSLVELPRRRPQLKSGGVGDDPPMLASDICIRRDRSRGREVEITLEGQPVWAAGGGELVQAHVVEFWLAQTWVAETKGEIAVRVQLREDPGGDGHKHLGSVCIVVCAPDHIRTCWYPKAMRINDCNGARCRKSF